MKNWSLDNWKKDDYYIWLPTLLPVLSLFEFVDNLIHWSGHPRRVDEPFSIPLELPVVGVVLSRDTDGWSTGTRLIKNIDSDS